MEGNSDVGRNVSRVRSISQSSQCQLEQSYLSEDEKSALMLPLASRPAASPTKSDLGRSGPSPSSRSKSSSSADHIPLLGFRYLSREVAAYREIGNSN